MTKGSKNERRCKQILDRVGYACYSPPRGTNPFSGDPDPWGMFDVLAVHPGTLPNRAVQVKTNAAQGITSWESRCWLWRRAGFVTEMWVRYDREGWRIIESTDDGYSNAYDEREWDCCISNGVVEWLNNQKRDVREL